MSNSVRIVVAAAAVVVVALIGYQLLIAPYVGGPAPAPSPAESPAVAPTDSPAPTTAAEFPAGALSVGRHLFTMVGIPFTLEVSKPGWISAPNPDVEGGTIRKGVGTGSSDAWILMWGLDGIYADPCGNDPAPPAGPSVADLASAFASIPGTEATQPADVTVGGLAAKLVVVTIPADIGCEPSQFNLWYDDVACGSDNPCGRWASDLGSTIRLWIVEVNGTRLTIEAETYEGATVALEEEIQQMIDSIQFE